MTPRQQEIFYNRTGYKTYESFLSIGLPPEFKTELYIPNADNQLWESGFTAYCLETYDHEPCKHGVKILLNKPLTK